MHLNRGKSANILYSKLRINFCAFCLKKSSKNYQFTMYNEFLYASTKGKSAKT